MSKRADVAVVWTRPPEHRDLDGIVPGSVSFGVILPETHPLVSAPVSSRRPGL